MATPEELYEAARKLIAEADRIQDKEARRPAEPEPGDYQYNCICFQKQFNSASPHYTYAAIQVNGYWYVTGAVRGKEKWTWNKLLEFIGEEGWESIVQMEEGEALSE